MVAAPPGQWDVALIGADPARAAQIHFTAAYAEIQATYRVPLSSQLTAIEDVRRDGHHSRMMCCLSTLKRNAIKSTWSAYKRNIDHTAKAW